MKKMPSLLLKTRLEEVFSRVTSTCGTIPSIHKIGHCAVLDIHFILLKTPLKAGSVEMLPRGDYGRCKSPAYRNQPLAAEASGCACDGCIESPSPRPARRRCLPSKVLAKVVGV